MHEKTTLPNGVRILCERIPHVRSASLGIWVGTGSRFESAHMSGASHFIEHMLFKGTHTRTAAELADMMDAIGGQVNAFTTKECTCFHGRALDTHLDRLSDVLCDMFFNSKFDEEDVKSERGVILEEIDMYMDTPEDLSAERLLAAAYRGCALSRPILGSKSSLSRMTGESLKQYMAEHYSPESTVVALSGSFSPGSVERLKEIFSAMPKVRPQGFNRAKYTPSFTVRRRALEQNHLVIAFPGLPVTHEDRFALQLLSDILGGGMSSRLFQTLREKLGLCYSVYSYGSSYIDTGLLSIYTALGRETEEAAIRTIVDELRRLKECGITPGELDRAREQVKANVLMGLESTSARMNRLGRSELYFGYVQEPDDIIAAYDRVTAADIQRLAERCLDFKMLSFSAVGRVGDTEHYREVIQSAAGI